MQDPIFRQIRQVDSKRNVIMQCESCKEREATIEFTTVAGDEKKTSHLCPACAAAFSQQQVVDEVDMAESAVKPTPVKKKKANVVVGHLSKSEAKATACPECGMTYDEFRKVGRLGCSACYKAFAKPLKRLLKRIHGADQHVGRVPGQAATATVEEMGNTQVSAVETLRAELVQAVEDEEYERAAQLRDEIARMQPEEVSDV
jgi:protein arginine kinase activator